MSLIVKKIPKKDNRIYLVIADAVYSKKTKNSVHKTVKSLGYIDELEQKYPDPYNYFKNQCTLENKKRKEIDKSPISMEKPELLNIGYFPFKRLYDELQIHKYLKGVQLFRGGREQYKLSDIFEPLVYARLMEPASKIQSYHKVIPSFYHDFNFSKDQMYDAVELLGTEENDEAIFAGIRSAFEENYIAKKERVYFDCTNFYFEIDKPTDFLKPGPSKENRPNPLIGLGLLIDQEGIPIAYKMYPGNKSEIPVFKDVLTSMKNQFNIHNKVIRIADKGLNCSSNIVRTYVEDDGYIFSESVRKATKEIKTWILDPSGYKEILDENGEVVFKYKSTVDYFNRVDINDRTNNKQYKEIPQKRVAFWSRDYSIKTKIERSKVIEKQEKNLNYESLYKKSIYGFGSKYIYEEIIDANGEILDAEKERYIDFDKVKIDEQLDGFNMLVTSELKAPDKEIIDAYKRLWKIEESFRILKTTLEARPVHHKNIESIKGHFLICMTALMLSRIIEVKKLRGKINSCKYIESLRKYKAFKISNKYQLFYIDDNLNLMSIYYGIRLNQKIKTEKEIADLFK